MIFAIDEDGKRVYIKNTNSNQEYFCPECGEKLVLKKGQVRMHHFAHPFNSECFDHWHYDMSDWHMNWQSKFPLETQEIVKIKEGQKHRADVLLEDKKVVFEFQHSPLSPEEFMDRNTFYNSLGYKVIWIFDVSEQFENGSIENYKGDLYSWVHPKRTFNSFIPKNNHLVEVYLEIQVSSDENERIQRIKKSLELGYEVYFEEESDYFELHKDDKKVLIKITWAPESGFKRFATDGFLYYEDDVINRFISSNTKEKKIFRLGDLADYLKEMYSKDHTTYYFGCPRSSSHICGSCNIDIPNSKYDEIFPCSECEYHIYEDYNYKCRKRFSDLGLLSNTQVEISKINNDGFISEIKYNDNGNQVVLTLPTFNNELNKSVFTIWKENDYKIAIFKNTRTCKFIKIIKNPMEQRNKYGKVYGYFSSDQYSFNGRSSELYGCDNPEWICVWGVK